MKYVMFRTSDSERPRLGALLPDGAVVDFASASHHPAFVSLLNLIEAGPEAWLVARTIHSGATARTVVEAGKYKLSAPIPVPPQFRDSMSFHKHIMQSGPNSARLRARLANDPAQMAAAERFAETYTLPQIYRDQPVYYKANRFNVAEPDEDIPWPRYSRVMDFELELACIIGRRGVDIPKVRAHEHIFGYTIFNDFSARDAQVREMEGRLGPAKGKDFDKGNVFGPCIVTADEIGDPYALAMTARVNGEVWCQGHSSDMHWRFDDLIAHISAGETLYSGEIIGSGTVGDGCGHEHMRYLNSGDLVELEIEKIGTLRNRVVRLN
jgi:2-keto-4-pentenoate hydratase/2-oxohepta-3-ene-1,7-dioic acid hydratase in catechol pathway